MTTFSPFFQGEAPADHHHAVLALGEDEAAAQGAGDLVADQDAAHGRADHQVVGGVVEERAHGGAQFAGQFGKLQDARALEIAVAVQAAAQQEVPAVQGAQFFHQVEDLVFGHGRGLPWAVSGSGHFGGDGRQGRAPDRAPG